MNFKEEIIKELKKHVKTEIILEVPNFELGDFAFPCFSLAKEFKKNPNDIAQELAKKIKLSNIIKKIEAKGPYLNFFINKKELARETLNSIYLKKQKKKQKGKRIVIEFPAPNTNKPLHLGHIRNMLIGECISKILEVNGNKVFRVNMNNDRGVHICKSMVAYRDYGKNKGPDIKPDHFVGKFYVIYNQKPELEKELSVMLKKWEEGDKEVRALWKKMNSWALKGFKETYKKIGIKFDKEYFESEYFDKGKDIVEKELKKKKGVFEKNDEDSVIVRLDKFNLPDKVVLRADGTSIYVTQDLELARIKYKDFKFDKSIYVVGSEQNLYFKQLFKIIELLKAPYSKGLYHLSYGMIYLPEGKMKSREGIIIDADDLMQDMEKLAENEIKKRHKGLSKNEIKKRSEIIGFGALKFFILKYESSKDFTFNPEESISFEGETGPYIQYAYARICSIFRKYKKKITNKIDFSLLDNEKEKKVINLLSQFQDVINNAAENYKPHLLCYYLLGLAQAFNEFYHECNILQADEDVKKARLLLSYCVKEVLSKGLSLLGIKAPEEM